MAPSWIRSHRRVGYGKVTLSPFLFLFIAHGLSALLKDGEEEGNFTSLKVCRSWYLSLLVRR